MKIKRSVIPSRLRPGLVGLAVVVSAACASTVPASVSTSALPEPAEERFYQAVEWSPDGERLAFSEYVPSSESGDPCRGGA